MAILGQIRKRSFFLIVVIGMALFAFVISGVFVGSGITQGQSVGEINGEEIDYESFNLMVQQVQDEVGSIDRVTNAGAIMPMGKVADLTAKSINTLMRINYEGTVNIITSILPAMIERNEGQIILFGSRNFHMLLLGFAWRTKKKNPKPLNT